MSEYRILKRLSDLGTELPYLVAPDGSEERWDEGRVVRELNYGWRVVQDRENEIADLRRQNELMILAIEESRRQLEQVTQERDEYKRWVSDLQSGMYINCVYCGHRYGPEDEVPPTMADALKEHIEACPKHPMSHLRTHAEALAEAVIEWNRAKAERESWTPVIGQMPPAHLLGNAKRANEMLTKALIAYQDFKKGEPADGN